MSNQINTTLIERAHEVIEELTSHPSGIDNRIQALIDIGDLNNLQAAVADGEAILAEEFFKSYDVD